MAAAVELKRPRNAAVTTTTTMPAVLQGDSKKKHNDTRNHVSRITVSQLVR